MIEHHSQRLAARVRVFEEEEKKQILRSRGDLGTEEGDFFGNKRGIKGEAIWGYIYTNLEVR